MDSLKRLKTPLRYPGGKSRATKQLDGYFPHLGNYTNYREPFLGGGSVALFVSKKYPNLNVWVNDKYWELYNFWNHLRDDSIHLHNEVIYLKSGVKNDKDAKNLFLECRELLNAETSSDFDRAVYFYVVNKCSFSGLTQSSGFSLASSKSNFSIRNINTILEYAEIIKNWKITNLDYSELLDDNPDTFVYLDPPYDIKDSLYGKKGDMHKGFDHDLFAERCNKSSCSQLISYNADEKVTDRFDGWNMDAFDLTYTMRSVGDYVKEQKKRKELVMYNYDISNYF
tara:strand:+ start:1557 stop:2405 length:849 start_codon:yes stop_codon:yes gene_type:complete